MNKTDIKAIGILLLMFLISVTFSFFFHDTIANNDNALNLIVNVFSILTGFLLLVISMTSDTASILDGLSKQEKINQKKRFEIRFTRYYILFISYFIVLIMIFMYFLVRGRSEVNVFYQYFINFLEISITFLSALSFLLSSLLPMKIKEFFYERKELNKLSKK